MTQIKILVEMLESAEKPSPWKAADFQKSNQSLSGVYAALSKLTQTGLVKRINGGFILGSLILEAGPRYQSGIAKATSKHNMNMEELYGKAQ